MPRHLAIVPAYNEAAAIAAAVADLRAHAPDFDVVVVDDAPPTTRPRTPVAPVPS
jgi:glycosyltransferase involved in cell wall biosynthesis